MAKMKKKVCGRWLTEPSRRGAKIGAGCHDRECHTARTKVNCRIAPKDFKNLDPSKGWNVWCGWQKWDAKRGEWRGVAGSHEHFVAPTLSDAKSRADGFLNKA